MMNIWRWICGGFDIAIYWFVETLFQIIMDLSNVEIFSQSVINDFARRIYIILGLIMVFKIMISFIQILINPEKMNDKEQGVSNILIRVVKALLMIVLVPMIFKTARLAQNYVIPVIPKVILGVTINPSTDGEASETMASVGRMMAFYSFLPFFNYDNTSCDDGSIYGTGTQLGTSTTVPEIYSVTSAIAHVNDKDCNTTTSKDGYKYNYRWLISTFVGAYLVYVLVSIAVSIAIRTLKFAICEFAAPIPIASYVDPKTSKQTFDTWVSTTWKIYLDLFIRLIIVYFIIFVFDTIFQQENLSIIYAKLNNDWWRCSLVTLFLIVGLLQFAKSAPKFIGDMLGLKGSGDFMGMFKGEGWKALGSTAAVPAAGLGAMASNIKHSLGNKEKWWTALRRGGAGLVGGTARGVYAAANGKGLKDVYKSSVGGAIATSRRHSDGVVTKKADRERYENDISSIIQKGKDTLRKKFDSLHSANLEASYDRRYSAVKNGIDSRYNSALANIDARENSEITAEEARIRSEYDSNGSLVRNRQAAISNNFDSQISNIDSRMNAISKLATGKNKARYEAELNALAMQKVKLQEQKQMELSNLNTTLTNEMNQKIEQKKSEISSRYKVDKDAIETTHNNELKTYNNAKEAYVNQQLTYDFENWIESTDGKTELEKETKDKIVLVPRPVGTIQEKVSSTVSVLLGEEPISSKEYSNASTELSNSRSRAYTGEAMKKLSQNGTLVLDEFSVTMHNTNRDKEMKVNANYSTVKGAITALQSGSKEITIGNDTYTNEDIEFLKDVFTEIEKKAAVKFVDRACSGEIDNVLIKEEVKKLSNSIRVLNIEKDIKAYLLRELSENPGQMLKVASDLAELFKTGSANRQAYERVIKEKNK